MCYSIRVEMAAQDFTEACDNARKIMVYAKVVATLPEHVVRHLSVQFAAAETVPLEAVIRIASVMESVQECSLVSSEADRSIALLGTGESDSPNNVFGVSVNAPSENFTGLRKV